jgi:hypothetical protein
MEGWPCGQESRPTPECHQQRYILRPRRGAWVTGFDRGVGAGANSRGPADRSELVALS